MTRIMKQLKSSVMILMHWFGRHVPDAFTAAMQDEFDIVRSDRGWIELSLRRLSPSPTVIMPEPDFLSFAE